MGFLRGAFCGISIGACCLSVPAYALDSGKSMSQYVHDKWGQDRGFLGGNIHAICQSGDGYLWIGTERGLVRFDGVNFTLMQRPIPQSPPIGTVYGLVADGEGGIWVRLGESRLLHYREGRFEDLLSGYGLEPMVYTAMAPDNQGGLLLSGFGAHIQQYSGGGFTP